MDTGGQSSLAEALDRLWVQFLPEIEQRVAIVESANAALAADRLSQDQRAGANAAAHKLAGVLGTFGLTKGTILAREAEIVYSGEPDTDPAAAARLSEIAGELRSLISNRK
ncbi:MAG TPA: Hpt domain-containing protein [Terracidiphilus sp.]|jgi:HPt (histidine-containing phosphotransfer) domain-containing protein